MSTSKVSKVMANIKWFMPIFLVSIFLEGCGSDIGSLLSDKPPIAVAGKEQTVNGGNVVTLDGSQSLDPDGDPITYSWIQIKGPAVILQNPTTVNPTFMAPSVTADTLLIFQLTVSDRILKSSDTVIVTVKGSVSDPQEVPKVRLSSPIVLAKPGDILSLDVVIENVFDVFYVAFDLAYDPDKMEFIEATNGPFLQDGPSESTFFMVSLEDGKPGKVVIGLTRLGNQGGISGSGTLMTMTFRPLVKGSTTLSFAKPREIKNKSNQTIAMVRWENYTIAVQ